MQIYVPISYVTKMTQSKNDSINSRLQHVVVFPISRSPYLVLCPRQCKWKVATTYLAITTKTIEIFDYENLLLLKPPKITRSNIEDCDH